MSPENHAPPRKFLQTDWGLVGRAARGDQEGREALGTLLLRYMPALKAHLVHHKGLSAENADELLQEFVASKILEGEVIARAHRNEGKFRTFLLTALNRFALNQMRHRRAKKRTPEHGRIVPLGDQAEPTRSDERPADAFHAAWAHEVVRDALRRMQAQCERSGREDLWAIFQCRIVDPILEGTKPIGYRQLTERFGFRSPIQASNALITAKRMYARTLRSVLAEYARDDQEVDEEIEELREALSQGRAG